MAKDLLLEIGSEELPASFVLPALQEMRELFTAKAASARLAHGEIHTYGAPRRLALLVEGVAERQGDLSEEILGPPVKVAFSADGKPTQVAEKWAAAHKVGLDELQQKDTPRGRYVFIVRSEKGKPAGEVLPELLAAIVEGIHFRKSMRWGWEDETFARPVQWIAALFGDETVDFRFADVKSSDATRGHRFLAKAPIVLGAPAEYLAKLEEAYVFADHERRMAMIKEGIAAEAAAIGGKVLDDPALLETVTFLVEHPTAVLGSFDKEFLELPPEVLVSEAKGHQKYFSVVDGDGKLLPAFVAVSGTPIKDKAVARAGFERVLRARLSDARFFFTEDKKRPLAERVDELKRVVFQQKLGTSYEKMERFRELAAWLADSLGLGAEKKTVERAAYLCKADLVTGMVGEFPELQGVMGREYSQGVETPEVALAIFEHYLPRSAGDSLPTRDAGAIVGIADRLDTITGIIGIGKGPTGAADPYGLRRACLAVINIVLARGYRFSLGAAVDKALALLGKRVADHAKTRREVLDFFRERLKNLWAEDHRRDVVEAVLSAGFDDMVDALLRLKAMSAIVGQPDFEPLAAAFKRAVNIIEKQAKDVAAGEVDPGLFSEEAERGLHQALVSTRGSIDQAVRAEDYPAALRDITGLKPAIDRFFDTVRVMAEDPKVKQNRVALLAEVGRVFRGIADFSKIQAGESR
ncbi:MAG: glycine--tRNA ligase subunit beta [Myxococcales bacterium]|jgi:glycyl-tRNA synthetase beta chain